MAGMEMEGEGIGFQLCEEGSLESRLPGGKGPAWR